MAKTILCDQCGQPIPPGVFAHPILDLPLVIGEPPMDFCSQECLRSLLNRDTNRPVVTVAPVPIGRPSLDPALSVVAPAPAAPAESHPNGITFDGGPLDGQTHDIPVDRANKTLSVRVELEFEHGEKRHIREVTYAVGFGTNVATWPLDAEPWITPFEQERLTATPKIV